MDNSYFKRHWNNFAPQSVRQVPVHRQMKPSPKVVSIPVHFVGSECRRSDSALKIQKAFRGFLVRKSVKKIAAIKSEVDEIEKRISKKETVEMMRGDAKERLKVNETLMSLLFRLDSVKGVDFGVRDFRRAVIKNAIALQERVDSAVAEDDQTLAQVGEASTVENGELISETVDGAVEVEDSGENCEDGEDPQKDQTSDSVKEEDCNWNSNAALQALDESLNLQSLEQTGETGDDHVYEFVANEDAENESLSGSSRNSIEGGEENKLAKQQEEEEEEEIVKAENDIGFGVGVGGGDGEGNKRSRELLERMVEDNEKMMGMMVELFERNEMQTRMLSSLSHRVEQLEKALVCNRLRRRKRKQ